MKKTYPSIRVFEDPRLEKLTHVHPITPLLMWAPIIAFLYYRSFFVLEYSVPLVLGMTLMGLVVWTFTEYMLHRFVFHFNAETPFQKRIQFLIHGLHHDDPNDPTRLVMPPAGSAILGVLLYSAFHLFFALFGAPNLVYPFFASFAIGYLCYDYTHYAVHHFIPRSRLGKMIKQHHMLHHFADHDAGWGVSSPLWDIIMGTMPTGSRAANRTRSSGASV